MISRTNLKANQIAAELGVDPIAVFSILLSLLECLRKDEEQVTPEQQLAFIRKLAIEEPLQAYRAAKRFARQHGVPFRNRDAVAHSIAEKFRMADDSEILVLFSEHATAG